MSRCDIAPGQLRIARVFMDPRTAFQPAPTPHESGRKASHQWAIPFVLLCMLQQALGCPAVREREWQLMISQCFARPPARQVPPRGRMLAGASRAVSLAWVTVVLSVFSTA